MSEALSSLDYIYENGDADQKRQLIALLFRRSILWGADCFKNLLNGCAKVVFNHMGEEPLIIYEGNLTKLDGLSSEYKDIIEAERRKGIPLSTSQIQNTLSFLYDLANFIIEFYRVNSHLKTVTYS